MLQTLRSLKQTSRQRQQIARIQRRLVNLLPLSFAGDAENTRLFYAAVQRQGAWLLLLWAAAVPLAYGALLRGSLGAIRRGHADELASETCFLWNDYTPAFCFWELVETYRKATSADRT